MKRRLILLLVFSILLTGCVSRDKVGDKEKPITITIWHYYNGKQKEAFDNLLEKFNQSVGLDKGIIITAESKGDVTNLEQSIMASAEREVGSERLPDIFAIYTDTAIRVHHMGLLADISQHMTEEELGEYNPFFLEEGRLTEDGLQIFPVAKATELLYLNKTNWDLFANTRGYELSQLSTWEGIKNIAEDYYKWSGGRTFFGRDAVANFVFVAFHQLGGDIFQESEGKIITEIEDDILRKIWDVYGRPYIQGHYGAFGRFRSDDIKTGDIVAAVGSTSSVAYYPKEVTLDNGTTYPIEVIVLPLPNFDNTEKSAIQQGAGMAVAKSTLEKEIAAIEFLKWFTDVEQNIKFCIETGYFPVKTKAGMTELIQENLENMKISKDALVYENTVLGINEILSTDLYAPLPFENGNNKRNIITRFFTEELESYKKSYNEMEVEDRASFLEVCYEEWSERLKKELQD